MSFKSQESFDDECSDIIERSYSYRSASIENLSCADEDECLSLELMNKMTPAVLCKLRRCFKRNKDKNNRERDINRRVEEVMRLAAAEEGIEFAPAPHKSAEQDPRWLDKKGFLEAIDSIFGNHKYSVHASKLFQLLDPFSLGKIWWRQLVDRLVAVGAKKTRSRAETWSPITEEGIRTLEHCKRETLIKMVDIERADSFCYAAVSKGGRVGVYSGDLKLLHSYEIYFHRTGVHRRIKNCWITDALYLQDVQFLVISASDRSLTVYDASTLNHSPVYCITGLPYIPTCLAYSPALTLGGSSELALGTERGDVIRIRFLQPRVSLFHAQSDHINYYFWMELCSPPHTSYCAITTWRGLHSRAVRRVTYVRDGELLVTCAHDPVASVRIRHVAGKLEDYVFKLLRGVSCFHIVSSLHLLATGSCDGVVRLWETTQAAPFASLTTNGVGVIDVLVIAANEIVIAYCNNCWMYIWDLYEECLLQTIRIKFPFLGVLGKKIEFGTCCIHPGPAYDVMSDGSGSTSPVVSRASRRGSSVYQSTTGGLVLLPDHDTGILEDRRPGDTDTSRWSRPTLLVSCVSTLCTLRLTGPGVPPSPPGAPHVLLRAPPADTHGVKTPHDWNVGYCDAVPPPSIATLSPSPRSLAPPSPQPFTFASCSLPDLEELLQNAGLQGILEKDFVLMQGLKSDLNRKIAEMEKRRHRMMSAVSMRAPHLALPVLGDVSVSVSAADEMHDQYWRVMRLFPGTSATSAVTTPVGSDTSTQKQ